MNQALPSYKATHNLAEFLPDQYASYCNKIYLGEPCVHQDADRLIPASHLAEQKEYLLATIRQYYDGDDVRALLSQWSKYYFSLIIPAAVVVALVLRRSLNMALEVSHLVLRNGMPHELWLPEDALGKVNNDPAVRYRSLCLEHLAPQINALAATVRVAPRVLWNNVGHSLEYTLSTLGLDEYAKQDITFLFEGSNFFDSNLPNPLRHAIRYVQPPSSQLPTPLRVRRVCCLRNELPGEEMLCTNCPLLLILPRPALDRQIQLIQACEAE
ncbi:siderophore-iron reductase FhuF [Legionella cincinnatiensis]|uniref:Ferric iron reductase protein FhuF n=1 Tax=Legionella cincinnatiensis TaxID=28085 RepID=A0A378IM45_9GAMM|nr:siderophore-iron reductase FhuF [Legionella cincinnatiensis]KTC85321.1 Ferric iron reductase protein FhuF [Legionella cincinnatiensis]STX36317.1 Ferric iron reductase protein fhuF [Legionella cincinnatiensis]